MRALLRRNDIVDKHTTHTPRPALTIRSFTMLHLVHEHGKKRGQTPAVKGNLADQKKKMQK